VLLLKISNSSNFILRKGLFSKRGRAAFLLGKEDIVFRGLRVVVDRILQCCLFSSTNSIVQQWPTNLLEHHHYEPGRVELEYDWGRFWRERGE
jgi:hypothetical protein